MIARISLAVLLVLLVGCEEEDEPLVPTTVLVAANIFISLIRKVIPKEIRIPCFIVVIASFVTIVELAMRALFPPEVSDALGIFIPLIVAYTSWVYHVLWGKVDADAIRDERGHAY